MLVVKVAGGTLRPLDHVPKEGNVFRMDSTTDSFKRYEPAGFELEDAIELVRPRDLSAFDAPRKTAQASEALALGNKRLTAPQLLFAGSDGILRALPVLDISQQDVPAGNSSACISHGKGARLKPSINAVRPAATVLNVVGSSSCNR